MDGWMSPITMDVYASTLSPALDILFGFYMLVVAVFSIMGNVLVLVMAFKRSSRMKPPELLSVNLAVTDLGAAISMYPLTVASAWNHHWLGGEATCIYYGLAGFFFGIASIMNLTVLAIVRFAVSLNLRSLKENVSWKQVKMLCLWCWLYALMWALFPILGWGRYGPEPFGLSCSLAWGQMKHEGFSFVISMFCINLLAPTIVITCCYLGIAIKLHFIYKKSLLSSNPIPNVVKLQRRMLVIAILVSVGFISCWSPYGMVSLWSIFHDSNTIPPEVSLLPCMFAKSSTVYNPLIYYIFSMKFKREVKQLLAMCQGLKLCNVPDAINNNSFGDNVDNDDVCSRPGVALPPNLPTVTWSNIVTLR
ncbi:opsin 8, group member b [Solea solea]|uniref:opsin 8, group member b n=1 Tax=Solea solea TaxID=90069 RepID=UPI002729A1E7|nr:opsin 8, group member b [Solea solea]